MTETVTSKTDLELLQWGNDLLRRAQELHVHGGNWPLWNERTLEWRTEFRAHQERHLAARAAAMPQDKTPVNPNVSPTMLRCLAADIQHSLPALRERGYVEVLNACAEALEKRSAVGKAVDSQALDEPSGPNP